MGSTPLKTWHMGRCALESGDAAMAAIPVRKMTTCMAYALCPEWRRCVDKVQNWWSSGSQYDNPNAAVVGFGSNVHMAATDPDIDIKQVRAFGTFTQNLHDIANWP